MIELNWLRSDRNNIASALKKRGLEKIDSELSQIIILDNDRKNLKSELDTILAESNLIAKEIGIKIKNGEKDSVENLKKRSGELKEKSKSISEELKNKEVMIRDMLCSIPNVPDKVVPKGNSEEDNLLISNHEIKISNHIYL